MRRWAWLIAVLGALTTGATGENLVVKGNVFATWTSNTRVSPAEDAIVSSGDTVRVTVTGQIDINQETRHETHCDVFIFCHDVATPIHNFRTPAQLAILFEIRPVGGGPAVATARVGADPAVLSVPATTAAFETQYEIVALLEGVGSSIAPGRSAGSFDVSLDIDASGRAAYFKLWLNQVSPSAARATSPTAIADDLRTQGVIVAAALRQYAVATFPVPNAANNESHATLVRKAVDIAPGDVENTLALARYFRAVGLDAQADAELGKVVAKLENLGDPHSRRLLGQAYLARMTAALSKGGGIDPAATQDALSFADSASKAFKQAERPDLVSQVNFARGRLLRGLRTRESLTAATEAFKSALDDAPDTVVAETALQIANNRVFALKTTDSLSLSSLVDGPKPLDPILAEESPVAWDSVGQKLLVAGSGGLQWLSSRLDASQAAPAISPGIVQVGGGAIARVKDLQSVDYFSSDQVATALPVAGANAPSCTAPAPMVGPGIRWMTLSRDGSTLAVICNNTLRVFDHNAGNISQVLETALPAGAYAVAVAGPASCGTVLVVGPHPGQTNVSLTLLRGVSAFNLTYQAFDSGQVGSSPPPITADSVTFAADHVLVATSANGISMFRCSDGVSDGGIALPLVSDKEVDVWWGPKTLFQWISDDQLAVVRTRARCVDVIGWPSQKVSHFDVYADVSDVDLQLASQVLLPGVTSGASPRMLTRHRKTTLMEHPSPPEDGIINLDVPGSLEAIVPTTDGSRLFVQRSGSPTWIAETKVNPNITEGTPDEVVLDVLGTSSGWVVGKLDAASHLVALRMTDASGARNPVPLPDAPAPYYASVVSALTVAYNSWKQLPGAPEFPGDVFRYKDLPAIIANPSLLSLEYRIQATGMALGQMSNPFLTPYMGGWDLPSLSSGRGQASVTLCARPEARLAVGMPTLPFGQYFPDELFLGTESGNSFGIRLVPQPAGGVPGGIPGALCPYAKLVHGASPTIISGPFPIAGSKLQMLTPVGWVTSDVSTVPVAGWAAPDGSLLLLVQDAALPGQPLKFSFLRLQSNGTSSAACADCTSLPLLDAFQTLVPTSTAPLSLDQVRFSGGGPASMIMVDSKGLLLARPSDDETVVVSLRDGKVLARAPLGKPIIVTEHLLALTSGDKRVRFYRY